MKAGDAPYLSYHDVLLRHADVQLLRGPHWLNDQVGACIQFRRDPWLCLSAAAAATAAAPPPAARRRPPSPLQIIDFYFEYLAKESFAACPGLLLMSASSTFLVANLGPGEASAVLAPLGFSTAKLVLMAVNDNGDVEAAGGGSHWSLLSFTPFDNTFRHYDSLAGTNRRAARRVFDAASAARPGCQLLEAAAPRQSNGYDCGVFVLAMARLLAQRFQQQGPAAMSHALVDPTGSSSGGGEMSPAGITALRREVLHLIEARAAAAAAAAEPAQQ